ncbi:MAG: FkbM family methyltransferase [Verrucomicrobiaceae bacterium]|nr:FkbM family methyltransferase [Verrucomicrobiaceae bacterium]
MIDIAYKLQSLRKLFQFDNPWQLLLNHILFPRSLLTYNWRGRRLLVDGQRAETAGGIHAVLATDEYRQFLRLMKPEAVRTILDLGANIGSFSILADATFPQLERILVVEGDSSVLPRLQFNLGAALAKRAQILHAAVSGSEGTLTFVQSTTSVGSGVSGVSGHSGKTEEVTAITLSKLLAQLPAGTTVDLCKMDIEGSEYETLAALPDAELDRFQAFVIELHGTEQQNEIVTNRFKAFGFQHIADGGKGNHRTPFFARACMLSS